MPPPKRDRSPSQGAAVSQGNAIFRVSLGQEAQVDRDARPREVAFLELAWFLYLLNATLNIFLNLGDVADFVHFFAWFVGATAASNNENVHVTDRLYTETEVHALVFYAIAVLMAPLFLWISITSWRVQRVVALADFALPVFFLISAGLAALEINHGESTLELVGHVTNFALWIFVLHFFYTSAVYKWLHKLNHNGPAGPGPSEWISRMPAAIGRHCCCCCTGRRTKAA